MKIAHIIPNLALSGAEKVVIILSDYMQNHQNHDVTIFTFSNMQRPLQFDLPKKVSHYSSTEDDIINKIRNDNFDIIINHYHWGMHHLKVLKKLLMLDIPIIMYDHCHYYLHLLVELPEHFHIPLYKQVDAVLCLNGFTQNLYLENNVLNVLTTLNPLNYEENNVSNLESTSIIAVANWYREAKNLEGTLAIFKLAYDNNPYIRLHLVGHVGIKQLNSIMEKYTIPRDSVIVHGAVKNVQRLYLNSSILLMASVLEGAAMVILEAKSHGIPSVALHSAGMEEVINDNKDGFLIPWGNNEEAAAKINLLLNNKTLLKTMGKNAYKDIKRFDISNVIKNWDKILKLVTTSKDNKIKLLAKQQNKTYLAKKNIIDPYEEKQRILSIKELIKADVDKQVHNNNTKKLLFGIFKITKKWKYNDHIKLTIKLLFIPVAKLTMKNNSIIKLKILSILIYYKKK